MSQIKHIAADSGSAYHLKITLDHAPEPGEISSIEGRIQAAMVRLGVPAENVSFTTMMGAIPDRIDIPQENTPISADGRYLLCILVQTEEGGFTEDPDEVVARAMRGFTKFYKLPGENIAAVVLENVHLEAEIRQLWTAW